MALDSGRSATLEEALRAALPPGVAVAAEDPQAPAGGLLPGEAAAMARAVPRRRAEFAAGRRAARRAMGALGLAPSAVPMGHDRAPLWPRGMVGSISHCEGACAALVARAGPFRALALDLEPDADLPADALAEICLPDEHAWLQAQPSGARGRLARLIFSAKECAYKLQYPVTGKMLDFSDLRVEVDAAAGRFTAGFPDRAGSFPGGPIAKGRIIRHGGVQACVMFA